MTPNNLKIYSKEDSLHFEKFINIYNLPTQIISGEVKMVLGDNLSPKKCRFCFKTEPEVVFNEDTHVIPQLLNKAKVLSNFECDSCNSKFSKYESDFGHFLLIHRALFGHRKKKSGFPKFKFEQEGSIQRIVELNELATVIKIDNNIEQKLKKDELRIIGIQQDKEGLNVNLDEENRIMKIETKKPPYKPLNVFRVFLKIAISLFDENELGKYKIIRNLLTEEVSEFRGEEILLFTATVPILKNYFKHPICYLFSKKDKSAKNPDKIFAMFFGNRMYHIPLFSDKNYKLLLSKEEVDILKMPQYLNPLTLFSKVDDLSIHKYLNKLEYNKWNLSSQKLVKDETEEMSIGY